MLTLLEIKWNLQYTPSIFSVGNYISGALAQNRCSVYVLYKIPFTQSNFLLIQLMFFIILVVITWLIGLWEIQQ